MMKSDEKEKEVIEEVLDKEEVVEKEDQTPKTVFDLPDDVATIGRMSEILKTNSGQVDVTIGGKQYGVSDEGLVLLQ